MPQQCSICIHPDREAIDQALVAGEPLRNIAERCSVSTTALHRHKQKGHIAVLLTKAKEVEQITQADTLLVQVKDLTCRAVTLMDKAEHAGDLRTALTGIREARGCLELLAKVTGEINAGTTVNIAIIRSPEWAAIKNAIIETLDQSPVLKYRLIEKLEALKCMN